MAGTFSLPNGTRGGSRLAGIPRTPGHLPPLQKAKGGSGGVSRSQYVANDATQSLIAGNLQVMVNELPNNFRAVDRPSQLPVTGKASAIRGEKGNEWTAHSQSLRTYSSDLRKTWLLGCKKAIAELQLQMTSSQIRVLQTHSKLKASLRAGETELAALKKQASSTPTSQDVTGSEMAALPKAERVGQMLDAVRDLDDILGPICSALRSPFLDKERSAIWDELSVARKQLLARVAVCISEVKKLIRCYLQISVANIHGGKQVMLFVKDLKPAFKLIDRFNRCVLHLEKNLKDYMLESKVVADFSDIQRREAFTDIASVHCEVYSTELYQIFLSLLAQCSTPEEGHEIGSEACLDHGEKIEKADNFVVEYCTNVVIILSQVPDLFNRWAPKEVLTGIQALGEVKRKLKYVFTRVEESVRSEISRQAAESSERQRKVTPAFNGHKSDLTFREHDVTADLMPTPAQHLLEALLAECLTVWSSSCAQFLQKKAMKFTNGSLHRTLVWQPALNHFSALSANGKSSCRELQPASRAFDKTLLWLEVHRLGQDIDQVVWKSMASNQNELTIAEQSQPDIWSNLQHFLEESVDADSAVLKEIAGGKMNLFFEARTSQDVLTAWRIQDQGRTRPEDFAFSKFSLRQQALLQHVLQASQYSQHRRHLACELTTEPEACCFRQAFTVLSQLVLRNSIVAMRSHLMSMFFASLQLDPLAPLPPPPSVTLLEVELPRVVMEIEALIVSLHPTKKGRAILTSNQYEELTGIATAARKMVCDAQAEFAENLQRNLKLSWHVAFPSEIDTWKSSPRNIATWTTSSYIARVISSVLEQVTSEAEYLPAELQYRCLEYFLGEWLEAFNHHLLAVKNIKFSPYGGKQLEADVRAIYQWLSASDSQLKGDVASRLQQGATHRRWERNISLLLWQPGARYGTDEAPPGVPSSSSTSKQKPPKRLGHRTRIAPAPSDSVVLENPVVDGDAGGLSAEDPQEDLAWLAQRLTDRASSGHCCVIL